MFARDCCYRWAMRSEAASPPPRAIRVHAVDGTYELYRAHYSQRPRKLAPIGAAGAPLDVTATVGLTASLLALLADPRAAVTHLVYAFDHTIRSFRNDLFAGYKDDSGVPAELRAQFGLVERFVAALGVRVLPMIEVEADDALASVAARFPEAEVHILSPDKDLAQCLEGERVITVDRARKRSVTEASFVADKGFSPRLVPDFLALVGDPQDGIPGLPGFGEKTVAALLAAFGPAEAIPDDPASWPEAVRGKDRLAKTLAARRRDVALYKHLATLVRDVPLGLSLEDLRVPSCPAAAFEAAARELGAADLEARARAVFATRATWR